MKIFGWELRLAPSLEDDVTRDLAVAAAEQVWRSKNDKAVKIIDMDNRHAKHALALVVRNLRAGKVAFVDVNDPESAVQFSDVMSQLADDKNAAFIKDKLVLWPRARSFVKQTGGKVWTGP